MLKSEIWGNHEGYLVLKIYLMKMLIGKTKLNMKCGYKNSTNMFGYDLYVLDSNIFIPYKLILDFRYILEKSGRKEMKFLTVKAYKKKGVSFVKIIDD